MTTLREAAQQALEAMSSFESGTGGLFEGEFSAEIAAFRAALAEPEDWELRRLREELERCKQTCAATSEAWREEAALAEPVQSAEANIGCLGMPVNTPVTPPQRPAEPVQEPVAWMCPEDPERETAFNWKAGHCETCGKQRIPLYTAPPQQALTIERLRDALVASRIIPPAAVEDPDEYDDGVTLFRIEALHRRIT